jgi:hypothetical protein
MLNVIDFSHANTRPVPYRYIDTFCFETAGEDAYCASNDGYAIFHWDSVAWRIGKEAPSPDPVPFPSLEETWAELG